MKRKFQAVIVLITLVLSWSFVTYTEQHYTKEGMVVEETKNSFTCVDTNNKHWFIDKDKDKNNKIKINDTIKMTIFNNATTTTNDDEVIKIKKVEGVVLTGTTPHEHLLL